MTLAAGLLWVSPAWAAPDDPETPKPEIPKTPSVPGTAPGAPKAPITFDTDKVGQWSAPKQVWPAGGADVVSVPKTTTGATRKAVPAKAGEGAGRPGGLGVTLRKARENARDGHMPGTTEAEDVDPVSVRVAVEPKAVADKARVSGGVVFSLSRGDGAKQRGRVALDVDYSGFRHAYGANFGGRLRLVSLPGCVLSTPELPECQVQTPVSGAVNVEDEGVVSADLLSVGASTGNPYGFTDGATRSATSEPTVYALSAGASSGEGDFKQTSLSPAYSWASGTQGGEFTYSYPFRMPPGLGGPTPSVALSYSSGGVDGRTAATNSQPSWVGDGWDLQTGYIERSYRSCSNDGTNTGDLCWMSAWNATMVLNGKSTRLVHDNATGAWKGEDDAGWKIEQYFDTGETNYTFNREKWKVTTLDGTEYHFGLKQATMSVAVVPVYGNQPGDRCYNSNYALAYCHQGYRWNLDYVVDPRGNTMTYFYNKFTGKYAANNGQQTLAYDIAVTLDHIDYGTRTDDPAGTKAPMQVFFDKTQRCSDPAAGCVSYPDTPYDQYCDLGWSSCGGNTSPTFWTPYRLKSVRTQVLKADGVNYQPVDQWDLGATFPATPDGSSPAMWLDNIAHSGKVGGSLAEPTMRFSGGYLANRVESNVPRLYRLRLGGILNGAGGQTVVYYTSTDPTKNLGACNPSALPKPDSNSKQCFPQYYTPDNGSPGWGWFRKYLVTQVTERDLTGGGPDEDWAYEYAMNGSSNTVMWHHDDNELSPVAYRSWTDWRGYGTVVTRHGPAGGVQSVTQKLYYRGMHGDRTDAGDNTRSAYIVDSQGVQSWDTAPLRGMVREEKTLDGSTMRVSTISEPAAAQTAKRIESWQGGTWTAYRVFNNATSVRTKLDHAGTNVYRHARTEYVYDAYNQVTQVKDLGDMATSADNVCTYTSYARNVAKMFIDYPSQTITSDCVGGTAPPAANQLAGSQTLYDGSTTVGAAPTKGLVTKTLALASFSGSTPVWKQTGRTDYDAYGRPIGVYDALDRKTSTAYSPAARRPVTQTVTTNPLGHATTTELYPEWGAPFRVVDANAKSTVVRYDALGRLTGVWLPGRNASTQTANTAYTYVLRDTGSNYVRTQRLGPNGNQITAYEIYDGRFRLRQGQTPGPEANGGRNIADIQYDGRGLKAIESAFWNATAPSDVRLVFNNTSAPAQHRYTYDKLGRQTVDDLYASGTKKWSTVTSYDGDRVSVDPPAGGTATMTISNARGKPVELRQYLSGAPSGSYQYTVYTYDRLSRQTKVTDPAGNEWFTSFDLRGRATQTIDPDKGATTVNYDDAGQILSSTDARGGTVSYTYDALGRKTTAWHGGVTIGTKIADWGYDNLAKGQPSFARRYANGTYYTVAATGYDDGYRPLGTTVTIPAAEGTQLAGAWTTSTAYNVDGSVKSTTYPAAGSQTAETVNYSYDDTGLPLTTVGQGSYVTGTSYYGFGDVYQRILGSSKPARITTTIDPVTRRLTQSKTETRSLTNTSVWNEALTENYSYSDAGVITGIRETSGTSTVSNQCFSHDGLRQLTEAWTTTAATCQASPSQSIVGGPDSYWTSYRYDTIGNRTQEIRHGAAGNTIRAHAYNGPGQPHTLASVTTTVTGNPTPTGTDTFTYDAAGNTKTRNIAGKPGQTMTWDVEGHLAKVVDSAGTTSYVYDADGNRLIAKDATGTTLYLGGTELHVNTGGGLDVTRYYTCGGTTVAVRKNSALSYQAANHQGTAQLSINASTMATTRRRYDPFGNARGVLPAWPTSRGFIDGQADPTSLTHLGAREYDPTIGRFLSVDPIFDPMDPQQSNNYAYSSNSPVTRSDPTGMDDWWRDPNLNRPVTPENPLLYEPPAPQPICRGSENSWGCGNGNGDRGHYSPIEEVGGDGGYGDGGYGDGGYGDGGYGDGGNGGGGNGGGGNKLAGLRGHDGNLSPQGDGKRSILGIKMVGVCLTGLAQFFVGVFGSACVGVDGKGVGSFESAGGNAGLGATLSGALGIVISNGDIEDQAGDFAYGDVGAMAGGRLDASYARSTEGTGVWTAGVNLGVSYGAAIFQVGGGHTWAQRWFEW